MNWKSPKTIFSEKRQVIFHCLKNLESVVRTPMKNNSKNSFGRQSAATGEKREGEKTDSPTDSFGTRVPGLVTELCKKKKTETHVFTIGNV